MGRIFRNSTFMPVCSSRLIWLPRIVHLSQLIWIYKHVHFPLLIQLPRPVYYLRSRRILYFYQGTCSCNMLLWWCTDKTHISFVLHHYLSLLVVGIPQWDPVLLNTPWKYLIVRNSCGSFVIAVVPVAIVWYYCDICAIAFTPLVNLVHGHTDQFDSEFPKLVSLFGFCEYVRPHLFGVTVL